MKKTLPIQLLKKPFSVKEAISHGLSRAYISRISKAGVLDKVSRGVYQVSDAYEGTNEDSYHMATLRCGSPSAICLLSALEYYHLTDQISKKTWILVPHEKRVRSSQLKLIRSRNPNWNIGIKKEKKYWITTPERTLIECLLHKKIIGSNVALEAIKYALSQKKAKLNDLYAMAKKMKVEHRIHSYIEVLMS